MPTGFGQLWTAQAVSSLGDGVMYAALPLLALTLTRDPMVLAVVTATGTLPWLLFGVLGGALADRWDRRHTMWVADAARAQTWEVCLPRGHRIAAKRLRCDWRWGRGARWCCGSC